MPFDRAALARNACIKVWAFLKLFLNSSQNSILRFPKWVFVGFATTKMLDFAEKLNPFSRVAARWKVAKCVSFWHLNKILMIFVELGRIPMITERISLISAIAKFKIIFSNSEKTRSMFSFAAQIKFETIFQIE